MVKVVINRRFGGFSVSAAVMDLLGFSREDQEQYGVHGSYRLSNEMLGITDPHTPTHAYRADPRLVAAVEKLGRAADGAHAYLVAVEIPDGVDWQIEDYDGIEHVAEAHQTWS